MGESDEHIALVQRAEAYIRWRLRSYAAIAVFADLPTTCRNEKPPRIGGFVPDVFATDVPTTINAIGEAKTEADLEQAHTIAQLVAFLQHLRVMGGVFVLSVPWQAHASARRLLRDVARSESASIVEAIVIDELTSWH